MIMPHDSTPASARRAALAWIAACLSLTCSGCLDEEAGAGATTGGGSGLSSGLAGGQGMPATGGVTATTTTQGAVDAEPLPVSEHSWCVVEKVLEQRCQLCHSAQPGYGAPMALVTHADTQRAADTDGRPVHELMAERIHATESPMPPIAQPPLTAEMVSALDAWFAEGAPPGPAEGCDASLAGGGDGGVGVGEGGTTSGDGGTGPAEPVWPEQCEEFYEIRAGVDGQPYEVAANSEERVSFDIPVPWSGQVYALAIKPLTNNRRVVHHWILYEGLYSMVTSWSPGKEFETFAEGVGVYMPPSGNFRLEMHYYNVGNDQAELDDSGLEVCVTREPLPHVATTHMFRGPATVPPQQRVENVGECTVRVDEPVHLITSSPHMHSYGVHAKFEVLRSDGSVELIHDTPFDWEDQSIKSVDVELFDGDVVRTTCIYENDTNQEITFGEDSADEMCFNFARYYPRGALRCSGGGLFGGLFP